MALITLSELVVDIKGSIGGTTFSRNTAGLTAKKRVVGRRSPNASQRVSLNTSLNVSYLWSQLSFSEKESFNTYASVNSFIDRFGNTKTLTGYQFFKQLCQTSIYFDGVGITSPGSYELPPALPTFTMSYAKSVLEVEWSTPIDTSLINVYFYTTAPTKKTSSLQRGMFKLTDIRSLNIESTFNIYEIWEETHQLNMADIKQNGIFNIAALAYPVLKSSLNIGEGQLSISPHP